MEGRYPEGVWVVFSDCIDPNKESEFNQWYNTVYIPHMEASGFIRNTRRYENLYGSEPTFRGRPKYCAIAEVYRDDLKQALKEIRKRDANLKQSKGFSAMVTKLDTVYQRTGPEYRSERTGRTVTFVMCALPGCADTNREDEFNKWYDTKHSPETLEFGIYDAGYRYKAVDLHDPVPHHTTRYFSLYESSYPVDLAKIQEASTKARQNFTKNDPLWVNLLEVYFSFLGRVIYP